MLDIFIYLLFNIFLLFTYCKYVDSQPLVQQIQEQFEEEHPAFATTIVVIGVIFAPIALLLHYYQEIKPNKD